MHGFREMIIPSFVSGVSRAGGFLTVKNTYEGWLVFQLDYGCAMSGPEYRSDIVRYSLVWFGVG